MYQNVSIILSYKWSNIGSVPQIIKKTINEETLPDLQCVLFHLTSYQTLTVVSPCLHLDFCSVVLLFQVFYQIDR